MTTTTPDPVSLLCPACGLCCNGVLFGDVELQREDDAKQLAQTGLKLFRKGRKTAFEQPCACFDGKHCRIYATRPAQCRAFQCGLLRRVRAGKLIPGAALRIIAETRRHADDVLRLVRELGNAEEGKPLNQRYASVAARPIDLAAGEADLERRGELMLAVAKLVKSLQQKFLT